MAGSENPITDHLWQLGFDIKSQVHRLPAPIVTEGEAFYTSFEVTIYPERGEARRHFSRKGPARAEVKSNLVFEAFLAEQEARGTELKDIYTEKCAVILLDMLTAEVPTLSQPKTKVATA